MILAKWLGLFARAQRSVGRPHGRTGGQEGMAARLVREGNLGAREVWSAEAVGGGD